MKWISFFEKQPYEGQQIFYYGEYLGVWAGRYYYDPNDMASPHVIHCSETYGNCDRMDAPWWMPRFSGMNKPNKPEQPYPRDYPQ